MLSIQEPKDALFESVFNQFIHSSRQQLFSYALRLLPAAEAEEVIQEAHMKFYCLAREQLCRPTSLAELVRFTPLLFSITKNMALSRIRHNQVVYKYQKKIEDSGVRTTTNIENSLVERDEKDKLQCAIENLPPMCKQVFIQRKIHNKSHRDIALMFNISTKTVENHIAKGLKLCRQFMISNRSSACISAMRKSQKAG